MISAPPRVIARLDIKAPNLIKGIHLEGLRVIGSPNAYAKEYYAQGADEIIYMDIVATLYGRNSLLDLVTQTAQDVFVPLTVGGGLRSLKDVENMLKHGADKVAINTAAIQNPALIDEVAKTFGSQCLVLSVEAKQSGPNSWEAYTDNGREKTGKDVKAWCIEAQDRGAGEILLTSVDKEGTRKGFDLALLEHVSEHMHIPVIASGGCGQTSHAIDAIEKGRADAIAVADMLHYERIKVGGIKHALKHAGIEVSRYED